jgi:NAD(P)-dependent dehydrogenase (short-subunit alcohol dehydrogenase family)
VVSQLSARRYQGKVALVIGGSEGIGQAVAGRRAAEGGTVVIAARRKDVGEAAAADIRAAGGDAHFVQADATQEQDLAQLVAEVTGSFGRLDAAFNNAGLQALSGPVDTISEADWRHVTDANLTSTFLSLKHEIPALLASGGGAVVNNASSLGAVGAPGLAPYAAAKHGVVGLTRAAALELADRGVRVNALITGTTDAGLVRQFREQLSQAPPADSSLLDDQIRGRSGAGSSLLGPSGRLAQPEEIAAFAAFLLSDEAKFITGAALAIDGGVTAR